MFPHLQRAGRAELRQLWAPWKLHLRRANPGRRAKEGRRWPARPPPGSRTRGQPMRNPASPRNRSPQAAQPRHALQRSLDQRKTKVRSWTLGVRGPGHSRRSPRSKPRGPLMPVGPELRRRRAPPWPATGSRRRQTAARIRQGCSPETAETHRSLRWRHGFRQRRPPRRKRWLTDLRLPRRLCRQHPRPHPEVSPRTLDRPAVWRRPSRLPQCGRPANPPHGEGGAGK
jgi:hypothetical protein